MILSGEQMLLNDKNVIDKYFLDYWAETPVSYDGVHFEMPSTGRWVHVELLPYDRQAYAFGAGDARKVDYAIIRVRAYGHSPTLSFKLGALVQVFLECKILTADDNNELSIDMGIGDGNGAVPLDNGIFSTQIDFIVKKYN